MTNTKDNVLPVHTGRMYDLDTEVERQTLNSLIPCGVDELSPVAIDT